MLAWVMMSWAMERSCRLSLSARRPSGVAKVWKWRLRDMGLPRSPIRTTSLRT